MPWVWSCAMMLGFVLMALPALAAGASMKQKSLRTARLGSDHDAVGYGPGKCVGVQRSKGGTCVLSTHCKEDDDLEKVEFAFLCVLGNGEVQKHSYGKGGFDPDESFDSSISCAQCLLPTTALHLKHHSSEVMKAAPGPAPAPAPAPGPAPAPAAGNETKDNATAEVKKLPVDLHTKGVPWKNESNREVYLKTLMKNHSNPTKQIDGEPGVVSLYGPEQCIQTYLGPKKTCIMETKCKKDALKDHEIGLTCVNASGKSVRHLFGKNSFHAEETFDTLIECKICLGLDVAKIERPMSLRDSVMKLKDEIEGLKKGMDGVKADVDKLNAKVFPKADAKEAKPEQSFVTHTKERKQEEVEQEDNEKDVEQDDVQEAADADADAVAAEDEEDDEPVPVHHKHHRTKAHRHHRAAAQQEKRRKPAHHRHHHRPTHVSEYDESDEGPPVDEDLPDSEDARPAAAEDPSAYTEGDAEADDGW